MIHLIIDVTRNIIINNYLIFRVHKAYIVITTTCSYLEEVIIPFWLAKPTTDTNVYKKARKKHYAYVYLRARGYKYKILK